MERNLPHGRVGSGYEMMPDFRRFILDNTSLLPCPHVPEISLHVADEAHELWHKTEEELQADGLQPPFWAFAWAGGQGLARHVLDHPECVKNKRVLDFATGSGLVGIAAKMAGAASVLASDIDPFCEEAMALNAMQNNVSFNFTGTDCLGTDQGWHVILAGDVFYDRAMSASLIPWFDALTKRGAIVLVGDPGRSYLPKENLIALSEHNVTVTRALEDQDVRKTVVWRWKASE